MALAAQSQTRSLCTQRCPPHVGHRFRDNPLVTGPPDIRFYAGAPLVTSEGYRLGSLCVIDREPRPFDAESCNLLCNFAEMVVREIEKEKTRVRAFPPLASRRYARQMSKISRIVHH